MTWPIYSILCLIFCLLHIMISLCKDLGFLKVAYLIEIMVKIKAVQRP